jgi:hypothetical protein
VKPATPLLTALLVLIVISLVGLGALATLPELDGTWVMLQVYPQIAAVPLAGEVNQANYVVQIVEIQQDGETLQMTDTYCLTYVDDGTPLVSTEISGEFMAALEPHPRYATITDQEDGVIFEQEEYVEVRGAILEDVENDGLPTEPEDPRVMDQDEDGNPGMTVSISVFGLLEGRIYVVQRVRYVLHGKVVAPDRIEGSIEWSTEQNILGASNPVFDTDASSYPDPDRSKHVFIMVRAQDDWTCEWLHEHWQELFGIGG